MKGKFAFALCALMCALSVLPAFAEDDSLCFGANYTYMTYGGYGSHAVGGNVSYMNDSLYVAVGFSADVSGERNLGIDQLREFGVGKVDAKFFCVPVRVGYPFMIGGDAATFLVIPSLAFDMQFFGMSFTQKIEVYDHAYKENYQIAGFGFTLGASLNLGMQHKLGRACLRYGVDLDFGLLTEMVYKFKFSGFVSGSDADADFSTVADGLQFAASPYISVGFSL